MVGGVGCSEPWAVVGAVTVTDRAEERLSLYTNIIQTCISTMLVLVYAGLLCLCVRGCMYACVSVPVGVLSL